MNIRWRRGWGLLVLPLIIAAGCGGIGKGASASDRTVLVDNIHDEFAGAFIAYFPSKVEVHPGATIRFKQGWNGEPHSVTMGTLVDQALSIVKPLLEKYPRGQGAPPETESQFESAFKDLPFMADFDKPEPIVRQAAAQPCFLEQGAPPHDDPGVPCPKRVQPTFTGRQSYFSSGFIPFAGLGGNTYNLRLAKDIAPGTYNFYCSFHGPDMSGQIIVKPAAAKIPSKSAADRERLKEVRKAAAAPTRAYRAATAGTFDIFKAADAARFPVTDEMRAKAGGAYLAGFGVDDPSSKVSINEFLPRRIEAKPGQKVTWFYAGDHTVSFGVPSYFPILTVEKNGTVKFDGRGLPPAGGPGLPKEPPDDKISVVDGGTWDGTGFRSSGISPQTGPDQLIGFSLAFAKAGTYPYACLIHPRMVGTVVVR